MRLLFPVFLAVLVLIGLALAEYIPEIGCWTYPDKVMCLEPSVVNATALVKNVTCYSYDLYGTGDWSKVPCVASATLEPTKVLVCNKMVPVVNGQPDFSHYNPQYQCHTETWEGNAQLQIPRAILPWDCKEEDLDNWTKACQLEINKRYFISGIGNDVNGTKAITVMKMEEIPNTWMYLVAGILALILALAAYTKIKGKRST